MSHLVRGEAAESDEETDKKKNILFGKEVYGEASESDEDDFTEVPKVSKQKDTKTRSVMEQTYVRNVLQEKLIENNNAVWKTISSFADHFTTLASKQLAKTDQLLLKSQVSMQSAYSSLKLSNDIIRRLHEKTTGVGYLTNFAPKIAKGIDNQRKGIK